MLRKIIKKYGAVFGCHKIIKYSFSYRNFTILTFTLWFIKDLKTTSVYGVK